MEADLVRRFFAAADSLRPELFRQQFTDDVVWRFANNPTAHGLEAVMEQYDAITQVLQAMRHDIIGVWRDGDCVTVETRVFYHDRHGRAFDFPGCDLLFIRGNLLKEVRIFVDNHLLFSPPPSTPHKR